MAKKPTTVRELLKKFPSHMQELINFVGIEKYRVADGCIVKKKRSLTSRGFETI